MSDKGGIEAAIPSRVHILSLSKRLLFASNPLDSAARAEMRKRNAEYIAQFPYRIAMKRRATSGSQYWDSRWALCLERAVRELEIEVVRVNGGLFTSDENDRDAVRDRAENLRSQIDR